ncbi:hypothetical protein JCM16303_000287 [Sporobolomyces ruberrimus]
MHPRSVQSDTNSGSLSSSSASPADASIPAAASTKPDRPPRPMNAWLLFRNAQVKHLQDQNPDERRAQGQLSKIIAGLWKSAPVETKREYEALAKAKKEEHARLYPDYRYMPREKAVKKPRRATASQAAKAASNVAAPPPSQPSTSLTLAAPRRTGSISSSGASPRPRAAPPPGFHPYGARTPANAPLPPVDTSHASTTSWQPMSTFSSASAYPLHPWPPHGLPATEERQSFRGPVSAPAEFSHRGSTNDPWRPGYSTDNASYGDDQYSPSWPSASSSNSQLPFPGSISSDHARQSSFPNPSTLPGPQSIPSFEYGLYRAPTHTYHQQTHPPSPRDSYNEQGSSYFLSPSAYSNHESGTSSFDYHTYHEQSSNHVGPGSVANPQSIFSQPEAPNPNQVPHISQDDHRHLEDTRSNNQHPRHAREQHLEHSAPHLSDQHEMWQSRHPMYASYDQPQTYYSPQTQNQQRSLHPPPSPNA